MPNQTFLRIFGLLFPSDPGEPQGEILQTDFLDHLRVDTYANAAALSCKCGRFNVICLHPEDFKKISLYLKKEGGKMKLARRK